ncbi:MAG: hypothetical protein ACR2MW_03205 [Chthoniobacterales bacterium]
MLRLVRLLSFFAFFFLLLPAKSPSQSPTPDSTLYGSYPANYQEIVTAWLSSGLVDPKSVVVKWLGAPRQGQLAVTKDRQVPGYLVDFTVNARNVFGAYTGPQKHTALIHNGKVVTATGFVYH